MEKFAGVKVKDKTYEIWASRSEVEELNNQGNAALGKELSSGKQLIAQAINNAGGEASSDESLSELAEDIEQLNNESSLAKYLSASEPYATDLVDNIVTHIADDRFTNVPNITKVSFPNVITIGNSFGRGNTHLSEINLPSVESVGDNFLREATSLEELVLPSLKEIIGSNFLYGSSSLKRVILPNLQPQASYSTILNQLPALEYLEVGLEYFVNTNPSSAWLNTSSVNELYFPNLTGNFGQFARYITYVSKVRFPKLNWGKTIQYSYNIFDKTSITEIEVLSASNNARVESQNIRKIILHTSPTGNFNVANFWKCDNVIAEGQDAINELNQNIQEFSEVFLDYSLTSVTYTITFNANVYNILTQETKDKFINKGWMVAYS